MVKKTTESKIDRDNRFGRPMEWAAAGAAGVGSAYYAFRNLVRSKYFDDAKQLEGTADLFKIREDELARATDKRLNATLEVFKKKFGAVPELERFEEARVAYTDAVSNANGARFTKEVLQAKTARQTALSEFMGKHADSMATLKDKLVEPTKAYIKERAAIKSRSDKLIDGFSEDVLGIYSRGIKGNTIGLAQRFRAFSKNSKTDILLPTIGSFAFAIAAVSMAFNQFNTRAKLNANDKAVGEANERLDTMLKKADALAQGQTDKALEITPDLERARASKAAQIQAERSKSEKAALRG